MQSMWHLNIMLEAILLTKWQFSTKARQCMVGKPIFYQVQKKGKNEKKTRLKTLKENGKLIELRWFWPFLWDLQQIEENCTIFLLRNNPFQGPIKAIIFSPTLPGAAFISLSRTTGSLREYTQKSNATLMRNSRKLTLKKKFRQSLFWRAKWPSFWLLLHIRLRLT